MKKLWLTILLAVAVVPSYAGSFAQKVSDSTLPAIALASVLPVFEKGHAGLNDSAKYADAQLVAAAASFLLKDLVHEERPDGSDAKSFPSAHTAAAFALAGNLSKDHPKQKWLYYGFATLVGWSRVELDKHHWGDVAAGAALGYAAGEWSISSKDGILIGRVFRW